MSLPAMSLSTLTQYLPPRNTHKSLSNLDAGVAILATSFVSYHRSSGCCQPSHRLLPTLGIPFDFPFRAEVQTVTYHSSFRNPGASFPTHLLHWMFPLRCRATRLYHLYRCPDIFHTRISPLAFPSSRQIPWASDRQNVKVVDRIYQCKRRFT